MTARATVRRRAPAVCLGFGVALIAFTATSCATPPRATSTPRAPSALRFVGNVWPSGTTSDPLFSHYWDQVTPENGGKWGSVESVRDQMNWTDLDNAFRVAQENGIPIRLHTLIWGQQQPAWLGSLSADEALAEIEEWFSALAERYPRIDYIDVVNEPLHAPPVYRAALGGAGESGWGWVIRSFELARKYFPDSELHLNEYNILAYRYDAIAYVALVELLLERGLIDGIGVQGHSLERANDTLILSNLDRLAATGLPIYVTELDVNLADDARQAYRLSELYTLFAGHPAVRGITLWGYLEGRTWKPDAWLVSSAGAPRPALEWLRRARAGGDCPPTAPAAGAARSTPGCSPG